MLQSDQLRTARVGDHPREGKTSANPRHLRTSQGDHAKHDALCFKHFGDCGQYWDRRDTGKIQAFLRDYLDAPELVLCEVQEHCNQATGYPCWYFAYRKTPNARGNAPDTARTE